MVECVFGCCLHAQQLNARPIYFDAHDDVSVASRAIDRIADDSGSIDRHSRHRAANNRSRARNDRPVAPDVGPNDIHDSCTDSYADDSCADDSYSNADDSCADDSCSIDLHRVDRFAYHCSNIRSRCPYHSWYRVSDDHPDGRAHSFNHARS